MSTDTSENVLPIDPDYGSPNHIIIWLDAYIGDPTEYIQLKRAFSINIDPCDQTHTTLRDIDIANMLATDLEQMATFNSARSRLIAFTDPAACYAAFQRYSKYRIFFITSETLGQHFVPRILADFPDLFKGSYNFVYIFCVSIRCEIDWAMEYRDFIQMFDHEADLLVRMVRDAAFYFSTLAERESPTENPKEALRYYHWSKQLYLHYERLDEKATAEIRTIDERTAQIEANQRSVHTAGSDDDDDKVAESCT